MGSSKSRVTDSWLRNRRFQLLFTAQLISLTGSGVTTIALALFAHQMVGGASSAAVIGNALMLRILAFLIFSQLAGVVADRLNRKIILIGSDLIRFALLGTFPFVQEIWQIYLLIFLINAATSFFTPTYHAMIPEIVGQTQVVKVLSLSRLTIDMESILSPILAALLIGLIGLKWLFWFDAGTYLISALLVSAVWLRHPKHDRESESHFGTWLSEINYGSRLLLKEESLRRSLLLSLIDAIAGASAIVGTVVYVRDDLGLGDDEYTGAMTILGLGSSLMAIFIGQATGRYESSARLPTELHGRRHRWSEKAMIAGGLLLGSILIGTYSQPGYPIFVGLWFLSGVGQASIGLSAATLLAEHTQLRNRGKVYAAHFALTHGFWLITYPIIGHSIQALGTITTFSLSGIFCLLISLIALFTKKRENDHVHA